MLLIYMPVIFTKARRLYPLMTPIWTNQAITRWPAKMRKMNSKNGSSTFMVA